MAIPLPSVVADVGPGGPLVTSMRGMNALLGDMYGNQIKGVQAQYAPLTTQAEAASKLAYANLMGPQFLAKMMGNSDILANMSPEQREHALRTIYSAGNGQGTGNSLLQYMSPPAQPPSLLHRVVDNVRNAFNFGSNAPQQPSDNALMANQTQPSASNALLNAPTDNNDYDYDNQGNNVRATPDEVNAAANVNSSPVNVTPSRDTFFENSGRAAGIKEEGKEAGKQRAEDIKDLGDVVYNADTKMATLNDMAKIISSPEFKEIRSTPLMNQHELGWYAKFGTPQQQKMVGEYQSLMGNVVRDFAQDFKGAFRKGEQQLITGVKPNDKDMPDVAIGKAQSIMYLTQLVRQRSALTGELMQRQHVSKLEADQMADKMLNGDAIRKQIADKFAPKSVNAGDVWPKNKAPINSDDPAIQGHMPPKGTVWMVTPKGMQVPVHESNVEYAKKTYNFRGINE